MTETEPTKTAENGSAAIGSIKKKIIRQVEFYFGDYNLMRDTFMKEEMKNNEGWFTMDTMLKFKRLASICSEPSTIIEALGEADLSLLEIDKENQRIRRKPNREVPVDSQEYRSKVKARTVHVEGFQNDENIDDLHEFISDFGKLEGIQLLRTPDKKFKGSLFATFFNQDDAEKFVQAPMVYYKCNGLTKRLKADYLKQLDAERAEKKRKAEEEKEKKGSDDLKGIVMLKVSGINDDTIIHLDIKKVFESKDVRSIRFFDRTEKMGSEGYLVFQEERTAEDLLKILEDDEGTKVTIKSAEVEFSVPSDEEKTKFEEMYLEARQKFFSGGDKRKKPKQGRGRGRQQNRSSRKPHGKRTTFDSDEEVKAGDDSGEPAAKVSKEE